CLLVSSAGTNPFCMLVVFRLRSFLAHKSIGGGGYRVVDNSLSLIPKHLHRDQELISLILAKHEAQRYGDVSIRRWGLWTFGQLSKSGSLVLPWFHPTFAARILICPAIGGAPRDIDVVFHPSTETRITL